VVSAALRAGLPDIPGARRRTALLAAALAALTVVQLLPIGDELTTRYGDAHVAWWALGALYVASDLCALEVRVRNVSSSVSMAEIPLLIGVFYSSPAEVLLARALTMAVTMYLWRRQAPLRIARNIALQLCAVASVLLFSRLALPPTMTPGWDDGHRRDPRRLLVRGADHSFGLRLPPPDRRAVARPLLRANLVTALLTGLMQAFLALLGVTLLFHDGRSGAILAVVALVLCACYRAYTLLRERADATELLFGYTSAAGPVISEDQLVATVAAHACEMMHTQHAEVWLAEGSPDGTYRVAHVGNEAAPVLTTRQALSWDVVSRVVEAGEPLLIRRRTRSPELQRLLRVHQMRDLVATAVRVDGAIVGVIVVGDRRGDLRTFRDVDVRLLEALASHTAAIVQNVRLFERLRFDSLHDALTGLPNRVAFQQAAIAATEARPTEPVAVLILDVNSFTQINDTLGHESGDSLLCEVGRRLRAALAAEATVARLGADEFGVLLPSPRDSDDVLLTARLILRALEVPYQVDGVLLELGASIGAAVSPEHADNGTLLLQRADSSMYAAKRDATGVELYSSDRDDNSQRRLGMATELRRAIERDELLVYYQPRYRCGPAGSSAPRRSPGGSTRSTASSRRTSSSRSPSRPG
jgi:diguanylate cyclase (GGDEF)-like protein